MLEPRLGLWVRKFPEISPGKFPEIFTENFPKVQIFQMVVYFRGVATGVYIGIYTPQNQPK